MLKSKKNKVLVEIYSNGPMQKKMCELDGNKVIIRKGKQGRGKTGYTPTYKPNSLILYLKRGLIPFTKTLKMKLMLIDGSDECLSFDKENKLFSFPYFNRKDAENLFEANALKQAGITQQQLKIPIALYLLLIMVLGLGVIQLLLSRGIIR